MIQTSDIKWGEYKQWEGPYYTGRARFVTPANPTDQEKILSVITATEGGCFDAVNMYDSCVLSSGLIQWCEAHYLVSSMIGSVAERDASLLKPLEPALAASGAAFRQRPDGKWRFFFEDSRGEVNSLAKQQALFFKGGTGMKARTDDEKAWTDDQKQHAMLWAACVASMWCDASAQKIQTEYTAARLNMFHTKDSQAIMHGANTPKENSGIAGAVRAAYCSFAANLPAVASEQLRLAVSQTSAPPWSKAWMIDILRQLTFGPKIAIYPGRYNKIRPVIEALYGVDLPDFAHDLSIWHAETEMNTIPGLSPDFLEIREVQEELIAEGYDIGPKGADGAYGPKTKQAIREFQQAHNLAADGVLGPNTRRALMDEFAKRAG